MDAVNVVKKDLVGSFFKGQIADSVFFCILLIYVLFGLDIATTDMILSLGGFEANPVMVPMVDNMSLHLLLKGIILILIAATAQWSEQKIKRSGLIMLVVIIGWYSFVVMNNTSVLIRLCGQNCPFSFFPLI